MANSLLGIRSADDLDKEERQAIELEVKGNDQVESALSAHISRAWEANKAIKIKIESNMLKNMRQRDGVYSPAKLQKIKEQGGSEIFMMITSTKCRAAAAWIRDILLPAGDKAWDLEPTPVPDMPEWAQNEVAARMQQTPEMGQGADRIGKLRDEIMSALDESAKEAADRMGTKIDDQLAEGKWEESMEEFIDDFVTFPAAIIKGPVPRRRRSLSWGGRPGNVQPIVEDKIALEFERVSPFDLYPSAGAVNTEDGELIERIRYSRSTLYNSIGLEGYDEANIRKCLEEYGRGGLTEWLWTDSERATIEQQDQFWRRTSDSQIDGLHYWGTAQGVSLLEWGIHPDQIPDPLAEYSIDAIKIGRHIIRAVINDDPMSRRPYHKSCFQRRTGSFWGKSLPDLARDIQDVCNATARALINNMAIASGPQCEVNYDRLADTEDPHSQYPWKVWQTKSSELNNNPAIRYFQPTSNANELMAVYEKFEQKADDATGVPRYTYGNERVGGAGQTASGLSMLMNSAARNIKMAIAGIDTYVIKPVIEQLHFINMIYDRDQSIKGDVNIIARGANSLLVKEQVQQRVLELLGMTNNPVDLEILGIEGRADMLREVFRANDMKSLVPSRDDFARRMQEQQEQQGEQVDPDIVKIRSDSEIENKKIEIDQQIEMKKIESNQDIEQKKLDSEIERWRQQAAAEKEKADADRNMRRDIEIQRIQAKIAA